MTRSGDQVVEGKRWTCQMKKGLMVFIKHSNVIQFDIKGISNDENMRQEGLRDLRHLYSLGLILIPAPWCAGDL